MFCDQIFWQESIRDGIIKENHNNQETITKQITNFNI